MRCTSRFCPWTDSVCSLHSTTGRHSTVPWNAISLLRRWHSLVYFFLYKQRRGINQQLIGTLYPCPTLISGCPKRLNRLNLNKDKTELLYLFSKYSPQQSLPPLHFGTGIINPSPHARNIGATFDTTKSMLPHVNNAWKSAFYHLRTISHIRKYLSTQTTEILIHAFVTSKLDHCNSLRYDVPKNVIKKLQSVQNAAARLITRSRKCDHITLILFDLYWLSVSERIKFKNLLLTFKTLHQYLIAGYLPSRSLRSSSTLSLNPVSFNWP